MADELKPCPFCPDGGKPAMLDYSDTMHIVKCTKCGCITGNVELSIELAKKNWHTRYERTCHLEQIPYAPGEYEGMRCSVCKTPDPDMGYGPYCAGCGAKVVDDD